MTICDQLLVNILLFWSSSDSYFRPIMKPLLPSVCPCLKDVCVNKIITTHGHMLYPGLQLFFDVISVTFSSLFIHNTKCWTLRKLLWHHKAQTGRIVSLQRQNKHKQSCSCSWVCATLQQTKLFLLFTITKALKFACSIEVPETSESRRTHGGHFSVCRRESSISSSAVLNADLPAHKGIVCNV